MQVIETVSMTWCQIIFIHDIDGEASWFINFLYCFKFLDYLCFSSCWTYCLSEEIKLSNFSMKERINFHNKKSIYIRIFLWICDMVNGNGNLSTILRNVTYLTIVPYIKGVSYPKVISDLLISSILTVELINRLLDVITL